jgi:hypothetical protein
MKQQENAMPRAWEKRADSIQVSVTKAEKARAQALVRERGFKSISDLFYPTVLAKLEELERSSV